MSKRDFSGFNKPKFGKPLGQNKSPDRALHNPNLDILKGVPTAGSYIPTTPVNQPQTIPQQQFNAPAPQNYSALPSGEHFEITQAPGMGAPASAPTGVNIGPDAHSIRLMNISNYYSKRLNLQGMASGRPELSPEAEKMEVPDINEESED